MTDYEFHDLIKTIIFEYKGDGTKLGNSIGALIVGRYVGWKVVSIAYSENTISSYQKILGVRFKDVLPERGIYSSKSFGLKIVDRLDNFWRVVQGRDKMDRKERSLFET